jgi:hypothetical protein
LHVKKRGRTLEGSYTREVLYVCIGSMREKAKKNALTKQNKKENIGKECCYDMKKNQRCN